MSQVALRKRLAPTSYRMYQLIWQSLDWLFPPECGGCGQKGKRWCQSCQSEVEIIGQKVCPTCGEPQKTIQICKNCRQIHPAYQSLRSWGAFNGPLREALHHLKYRKDISLGESLSRPLIAYLENLNWPIDLVVPIPLGKQRLKQRGYNQAALIARPVALARSLRYSSKALLRIKDIPSQVGMTINQRKQNVAGAFWANPELTKDKNILVVDDVTTTGATIDASAHVLMDAGAHAVYALTLARAILGINQIKQ